MTGAGTVAARVGVLVGCCAVLLLGLAGPALGHVTVFPSSAPQGDDAVLTFNVPDEDDQASTTEVELALPTEHPIASVAVRATPGWTAHIVRSTLSTPLPSDEGTVTEAVTRVVWRADGPQSRIGPGQFQEFVISAGPLPETRRLVFKVLQHYSDGRVVRWIDPPTSGEALPHPAPVLALTRAGDAADPATAPTAKEPTGNDPGGRRLAIAALAGAGLALLVSGAAFHTVVRRHGNS